MSSIQPRRLAAFALALSAPWLWVAAAEPSVPPLSPVTAPSPQVERPAATVMLPVNTVVELELLDGVGSALSKTGDRFRLRVAQDVVREGRVLIPAGTPAVGQVVHAARASAGGKGGELILAARHLESAQGELKLRSSFGAAGKHRLGPALATSFVVGPFAMLIKGRNVELPAGSALSARLAADTHYPVSP